MHLVMNLSGDRHWLHRWLEIQLPYNHNHDGPQLLGKNDLIFNEITEK